MPIVIAIVLAILSPLNNLAAWADYREFTYITSSDYGQIYVFQDTKGNRCLYIGDPAKSNCTHTCKNMDRPDLFEFEYQKLALVSLYINPAPKKVLMLGLGGGTLVSALMDLLPTAQIDVVEINQAILDVAKDFFAFKPNGNTSVIITDGYEFIKKQAQEAGLEKYDLVILDAFDQKYIPAQFLTKDFVKMLHQITAENGVIVVNAFLNSKYASLENSLYKNEFGRFLDLKAKGNRLIITSPGKGNIALPLMEQNVSRWSEAFKKYLLKPEKLMQKVNKATFVN